MKKIFGNKNNLLGLGAIIYMASFPASSDNIVSSINNLFGSNGPTVVSAGPGGTLAHEYHFTNSS